MSDVKELKDEELKKANGGDSSIGDCTPDYIPTVGKIYSKKSNAICYARVTSVNKTDDLVFYDIGFISYAKNGVIHTTGSSSKLTWDFLDEWEYYSRPITNWD